MAKFGFEKSGNGYFIYDRTDPIGYVERCTDIWHANYWQARNRSVVIKRKTRQAAAEALKKAMEIQHVAGI